MIKEIAKNILKGTLVALGTKVAVEKVIPAGTEMTKNLINKKNVSKEETKVVEKGEEADTDEKATHREAKTEIVDTKGNRKVTDPTTTDNQ